MARQVLQKAPAVNSVFYPFSGPTSTNPLRFFPDAPTTFWSAWSRPGASSKWKDFHPEYGPLSVRAGKPPFDGFFKTENMQRDLPKARQRRPAGAGCS